MAMKYEIKREGHEAERGERCMKLARAERLLATARDWNPGAEWFIFNRETNERLGALSTMDRLLAADQEG